MSTAKFIIGMRDAFFNALYEYFQNDKNAVFITADNGAPSLDKFSENLGMYLKRAAISNANTGIDEYQIDHTTSILLVNPDAKVKAVLSAPHRVGDLYNDIMTIIEN